jgi:hypothetical protein
MFFYEGFPRKINYFLNITPIIRLPHRTPIQTVNQIPAQMSTPGKLPGLLPGEPGRRTGLKPAIS